MKAKIIGLSILGVVISAVVSVIVFVGPVEVSHPKQEVDDFKNWNRSGPFAINKAEYKIGENVFMAVGPLQTMDVGNAVFVMPNGTTKYISIPFNGTEKPGFNQYFKPSISKGRGICSVDDLIGEWTVVFTQTEYVPLKFRILNDTIPSEVGIFQKVC
ncbi:MAG: hypothetical protein ACREAX_02850 [Candidatus Nitrosotenuis sp.]